LYSKCRSRDLQLGLSVGQNGIPVGSIQGIFGTSLGTSISFTTELIIMNNDMDTIGTTIWSDGPYILNAPASTQALPASGLGGSSMSNIYQYTNYNAYPRLKGIVSLPTLYYKPTTNATSGVVNYVLQLNVVDTDTSVRIGCERTVFTRSLYIKNNYLWNDSTTIEIRCDLNDLKQKYKHLQLEYDLTCSVTENGGGGGTCSTSEIGEWEE
jgi:hypothetical protein